LYTFAYRLKAFSFRDCVSGPLFRAILVSAGLLAAVFLIRSAHLKLVLAAPLTFLCLLVYAVIFWALAVDEEDRTTISTLRERAFANWRSRRSTPALHVTGNNASVLIHPRQTHAFANKLIRITFLLPGYAWAPSGGFRVIYEHANRLAARGHLVSVIHPRRLRYCPPPELTFRQRIGRKKLALMALVARPSIAWQTIDKRVRLLFVPSSDERHIPDADVLSSPAGSLASARRCAAIHWRTSPTLSIINATACSAPWNRGPARLS
jgi:hypothetical protein